VHEDTNAVAAACQTIGRAALNGRHRRNKVTHHLQKVAVSSGGWELLFRDPTTPAIGNSPTPKVNDTVVDLLS
jgi:hypothetical protein